MNVLVLNLGSSSLKLSLFDLPKQNLLLHAHVDGIGSSTTKISFAGVTLTKKITSHKDALQYVLTHLPRDVVIDACVHRVVHGGETFTDPVNVTASVISQLEKLVPLAPLHLPANIEGLKAARSLLPKTKQLVVFDTGFHRTLPEVAYRYGVPQKWFSQWGIRKYGFHGMSHEYITQQANKVLKKKSVNIISCHLGNGSSVTLVHKNKSVDTSMGFSPLSGVMMGTRSGDVDPEIIFFLQEQKNMSLKTIRETLEKYSGFSGLMGTNDMRDIFAAYKKGDKQAALVIDLFSYQVAKEVGMFASLTKSLDALVFTGGLGEFAWYVRKKVCEYVPLLGIKLDAAKNKKNSLRIHATGSKVKVLVIPTNEELLMVQKFKSLLSRDNK